MVREQTFEAQGAPALVVDHEEVYEDCTFLGHDYGAVVQVRANVTFRRCKVIGGSNRGIVVEQGTVVIEDCLMTGDRVGIWVSGPADATIRRCVCEGPGSLGILFRGGATGTIEDCRLVDIADAALMVRSGARAVIRRCWMSGRNVGLHLEGAGSEVSDCEIRDARVGVWMGKGMQVLRDCRVENCFSIGMYFTGPAVVERCDLQGNHIGICIYEGGDPRITDCTVEGGDNMGVFCMDGSLGTVERCRIGPHPSGAKVYLPGANTRITD